MRDVTDGVMLLYRIHASQTTRLGIPILTIVLVTTSHREDYNLNLL